MTTTVSYLASTILALHAEAIKLSDSELATIVSDVSVGLCLGDYGPVANQQFADCDGEWDTDSVIAAIRSRGAEESEAYQTGFEAANQGEPRSANPYSKGTWDSDEWFAGWDAN
jgi:hypothetical protein